MICSEVSGTISSFSVVSPVLEMLGLLGSFSVRRSRSLLLISSSSTANLVWKFKTRSDLSISFRSSDVKSGSFSRACSEEVGEVFGRGGGLGDPGGDWWGEGVFGKVGV